MNYSAKAVADQLEVLNEKVVFAESCTGGMVSAEMTKIPGISRFLCGSFVTYRPKSKRKWLGVKPETIEEFTTESQQVSEEMARGALKQTKEATWAVSIVGDLGPIKEKNKEGFVYISIWKRTKKGKLKRKDIHKIQVQQNNREAAQKEATEAVLTCFGRVLISCTRNNEDISRKENLDLEVA